MSDSFPIASRTTIGILGAGQLARMSAAAAFQMGLKVAVYSGSFDPQSKNGLQPLELMTPLRYPGTFNDTEALIHFAKQCSVVTLENEFLDGDILARVRDSSGIPMYPSPETFRQLESKWIEKETFRNAGIPVTPYGKITSLNDMDAFAGRHGYPFVLKSSKGGYDGYGNETVRTPNEHQPAFEKLGGDKGHELIAEAFIPFEKELAVQVARNHTGIAVYPCCETIQENHICKTVIAPAPVDTAICRQAEKLAADAVEAIDGTGLFAFEFFLTTDGDLLLNESAPRPHNSGHYTIEGCVTSQFENHIRAILGLPLGSTAMRREAAVMVNLLGTHNRLSLLEGSDPVFRTEDAHVHVYGKETSRIGRKMGHITVLGDDIRAAGEKAGALAENISI